MSKTRRFFVIISITLLVAACGQYDRGVAALLGTGAKTCVDNVLYIQFTSGTSVAYNTDGSIKTCP